MIIYSNAMERRIEHVDYTLTGLRHAGITLQIKKDKFIRTEVEYIGHINKPGKIKIDHAHTASLRNALPPTNKSEYRSCLEPCNVYCRFSDNFA